MTEAIHFPLRVTESNFATFILRDENLHRHFELIDGEIVEKMVADPVSSHIAGILIYFLNSFIVPRKLGYLTIADGGYKFNNHRVIPDIGFTRFDRYQRNVEDGYQVGVPDLVVEVMSPTDSDEATTKKVAIYIEARATVWLVNPKKETIVVYRPGMKPQTFRRGDILEGGELLVGFSVAVSEIFDL